MMSANPYMETLAAMLVDSEVEAEASRQAIADLTAKVEELTRTVAEIAARPVPAPVVQTVSTAAPTLTVRSLGKKGKREFTITVLERDESERMTVARIE